MPNSVRKSRESESQRLLCNTDDNEHEDDKQKSPATERRNVRGSGDSHFSWECVWTVKAHERAVYALAMDNTNLQLFSASIGSDIRAWIHLRLRDRTIFVPGKTQSEFRESGTGAVKSVTVIGDQVVTAHQDRRIRVWTLRKQLFRLRFRLPTAKDRLINSCCFLRERKNAYLKVRRHKFCLWNEHADAVSAILVADGLLYSASWDRTVKAWRLSDFRCVDSFTAHEDAINAMAFSAVSSLLFTASADGTVKAWRTPKHGVVFVMKAHQGAVNALAVSVSSDISANFTSNLHSGSAEITCTIHSASADVKGIVDSSSADVTSILRSASADVTTILYSAGNDERVLVWDISPSQLQKKKMTASETLRGHRQAVLCMSTCAEFVCFGCADLSVRVWRRERRRVGFRHSALAVLQGHSSPVKCITTRIECEVEDQQAESGRVRKGVLYVYSGSLDGQIRLWRCISQ